MMQIDTAVVPTRVISNPAHDPVATMQLHPKWGGLLAASTELQSRYGLTEVQLKELLKFSEWVSLKNGEHWLRPGDSPSHLLLVIEGVTRLYRVDDEGSETTRSFHFAGQWAAPWGEALRQTPSRTFGQALSSVTALKIELEPLERRAASDLSWSILMRKVMEDQFLSKEAREHDFMTFSATDRYLDLIRSEPRLLEMVSLQVMATYLGITPVALSRIRGRLHN